MSLTVRALSLPDLWAHVAAQKSPVPAANYKAVSRAVVEGDVAGVFDDGGNCLGFGAVTVVDDGPGIAWLSVADGGIGRHGIAVVKAIKAVVGRAAADRPIGVIALVAEDNGNGQRLARVAGFEPSASVAFGMRVWQWRTH